MKLGHGIRRLELLAALLLTVAACSSGIGPAAPAGEPMRDEVAAGSRTNHPPAVAASERGASIFLDYCSFCHGVSTSTRVDAARGVVRAASGATMSAQDFRVLLASPPARMPQIPLQPEQEAQLIEYLLNVPQQSLYTQVGHP